jgi:ATP-binding cassette subfamily B protein
VKYLRRILPYLRPYWLLALISVAGTLLDTGANLLAPWPLKILVDNALGNKPLPSYLANPLGSLAHDRSTLIVVAVIAGLIVTFLAGALSVLTNFVNTRIEQRVVLDFRSDLFHKAQRLGIGFHDRRDRGLLMYSINFEADAAGGLIMAIQPIAQSVLTLVGMFWISYQIDRELALLSLVVIPILYISTGYYANHIQPRIGAVKLLEAGALTVIHEALTMIKVIVAFGREDREDKRYRDQGSKAVDARVNITVKQTLFTLVVTMTTAAGTALVLGVGSLHVLHGELSVGQLLVIMAYIGSVYKPLESISYTVGSLQDRFVALGMAFHVLDTPPEVEDTPHAIDVGRVRGRITFEHVAFSYPNRPDTLTDISFDIQAGQVVALVGPTGAGKTTLMSLLPRFYDAAGGRILLDGTDIRDITLDSLRANISLVPQDPALFSGTIKDNIRYGRLDATDEEIIAAATDANAHEFIMRLPDQYETEVGERGAQLSGGERQRICVARAFLKDAPILILDEPTSAIDSKTESVILDALDRLMVGRTTFMIAHRLSTVRHSDVILVLNEGRLVEQGTHDELMVNHGLYRHLYDIQIGRGRQRRRLRDEEPEPEIEADVPAVVRPQPAFAAEYHGGPPFNWAVGERISYTISAVNTGTEAWPATEPNPVRLGVHIGWISDLPDDGWTLDERLPLVRDVTPGETHVFYIEITAPSTPGVHILRHRMVQEGVAWCDDLQKSAVIVHPVVEDAATIREVSSPDGSSQPTSRPGERRTRRRQRIA